MTKNENKVEFSDRQMSIWSLKTVKVSPEQSRSQTKTELDTNKEQKKTKPWAKFKSLFSHPLTIALLQGLGLGIISTIWALILVAVLWSKSDKQTSTSKIKQRLVLNHQFDLFFDHSGSPATIISTSDCLFSLTPFRAATLASWSFDGNLNDLNNIHSALYTNPPAVPYRSGHIGQAIDLSGSQYIYSNAKFLDLSYRSWTIEA